MAPPLMVSPSSLQRGASVDRERRVGVGQRVAAQRRGIDHLQCPIIGDRAAANADAAFELHRVLNRDAAAGGDAVGAAAHRIVVQRPGRANTSRRRH